MIHDYLTDKSKIYYAVELILKKHFEIECVDDEIDSTTTSSQVKCHQNEIIIAMLVKNNYDLSLM